jgi:tetratricopeptide (TPR) repeat protein
MFRVNGGRKGNAAKPLQRAHDAMRAKDWPEAALLYAEGLAKRPNDVSAWVQYGHALKESGDRRQAEEAYRRALVLDPDLPDTHLQLGHLLKLQGRFDEAGESYAQALSLAPRLQDAMRELTLLGWSASRVERLKRRTPQTEHLAAVDGAETTTVLFDVSDLIQYFQTARTPTGIQRVQICSISSILDQDDASVGSAIVCFTASRDFWIKIPSDLFGGLARLTLSGGSLTDQTWQSALSELKTTLEVGPPYEFRGGETLINLGTSWWLTNYFLMIRLAKTKFGIRYVPFVHDLIPIITPEHCTKELSQDFINWIIGVFYHADAYLVNSHATGADLRKVADLLGHTIGEPRVVRLDGGFDLQQSATRSVGENSVSAYVDIPKGPFVLFVGTIESRKTISWRSMSGSS